MKKHECFKFWHVYYHCNNCHRTLISSAEFSFLHQITVLESLPLFPTWHLPQLSESPSPSSLLRGLDIQLNFSILNLISEGFFFVLIFHNPLSRPGVYELHFFYSCMEKLEQIHSHLKLSAPAPSCLRFNRVSRAETQPEAFYLHFKAIFSRKRQVCA